MSRRIDLHCTLWLDPGLTRPLLADQVLPLPSWAELPHNAEEVVHTLCRTLLTETRWTATWGMDTPVACVWVTITAPPWLVGQYEVLCQWIMQPLARKVGPLPGPAPQTQGGTP